jgi:hypothetical protein
VALSEEGVEDHELCEPEGDDQAWGCEPERERWLGVEHEKEDGRGRPLGVLPLALKVSMKAKLRWLNHHLHLLLAGTPI